MSEITKRMQSQVRLLRGDGEGIRAKLSDLRRFFCRMFDFYACQGKDVVESGGGYYVS